MRKDHRPLFIKRCLQTLNQFYIQHFIAPQLDQLGQYPAIVKPSKLKIFGENIRIGDYVHIVCAEHSPVNLSCWKSKQNTGEIKIGDYCLISPGASILSAEKIEIEDNCMIAANVYISDSDWHGIYNRTRPFRCSAPIQIKNNAWIGYQSIINKGVTIGENSVVAAGSVVCNDVPANTIVGGNPARPIKQINPNRKMLTREYLFASSNQEEKYWQNQKQLDAYMLHNNTFFSWIRSILFPGKND